MTNSERLILRDYRQLIHPLPQRNIIKNEVRENASDDSGVGGEKVKETEDAILTLATEHSGTKITGATSTPGYSNGTRRNKRKSAEPKRRGELLLMKRFQWALNDETDVTSTAEVTIAASLCSAEEADRPSSGDSGCHSYDGTQLIKRKLKPEDVTEVEKPIDLIRRSKRDVTDSLRKSVIKLPRKIKSETLVRGEETQHLWDSQNLSSIPLPFRPVSIACSRSPELIVSRTTNSINGFRAPVDLYGKDVVILPNPRTISESNKNRRKESKIESARSKTVPNGATVPERVVPDTTEQNSQDSFRNLGHASSASVSSYVEASPQKSQPRSYYKSMSRQRRVEANARERTRVHTISAAFENLRRAVPAYADSQKLSKLAILKIASSYILALACLNEMDYSKEQRKPDLAECVELCTQTIQSEGKARRRGTKE